MEDNIKVIKTQRKC